MIVCSAAALGLAFWRPLQKEEISHEHYVATIFARSVQTELLEEIQSDMLEQVQLARQWGLDEKLSGSQWDAQAKLFIAHHPGHLAMLWVDPSYRVRFLFRVPKSDAYRNTLAAIEAPVRGVLEDLALRREQNAILAPAFRLRNGNIGRRVIVPIYRSRTILGFLVTVIDEGEVIDSILAGHVGLGYAITVLEDNDEIYRTPGSNPENEKSWAQDVELGLPGARWRVRVWPEAKLSQTMHSKLPLLLLIMGTVIGLLLFVSVDLARSVYSKTRKLRRSRSELELRVQERTQQLISANAELRQEINERQLVEKSLQDLSGRLLSLRDEEQRRIARELHDSTVQTLGAAAIDLDKARRLSPNGDTAKAQALLARSSDLVERAISELRTLSYLLHPPILDDLGLEGVLPWYTAGFSSRSGIAVRLHVQPLGRLSAQIELTVFRILQEGLANIHRHSGSSTAEITIGRDADRVTVKIVDHGSGIRPLVLEKVQTEGNIVGVGTAGMRERLRQIGGSLQIDSDKGGTSILATIPINTLT